MTAVVHLRDDEEGRSMGGYREVWNGVLRLFNLLQFLPGAWWTTREGMERRLYDALDAGSDAASPAGVVDALWKEAFDLVAPDLLSLLETLSHSGAPPPEVGFELCGEDGVVRSEAELAWLESKVAILWPHDAEQAEVLGKAGGRIVSGDLGDLTAFADTAAKAVAEDD